MPPSQVTEKVLQPPYAELTGATMAREEFRQLINESITAYNAGRMEEAVRGFEEAVRLKPQYPDIRCRLAISYGEQGRYEDAIEQFQETVSDPQRRSLSHHMLGKAFAARKDFDLALAQFNNALGDSTTMDDKTKGIVYDLAKTYEDMGDADKALKEYLRIYEVDIKFRDVSKAVTRLREAAKAEE